jgi:rSAM/selenodomain-associated transferase 1
MRELGLLARYWTPGQVKTRLAATVGPHAAADIHRAFVETLLARLADVGGRRVVACTPDERVADFARLAGNRWQVVAQPAGDLGERLRVLFAQCFARGSRRVVLIGSDAPTLPVAHVERAFDALERVPAVLGPADDGGYYLVGAADEPPPIFEAVDWGTSAVWEQTVERLAAKGCPYQALAAWYDVDTAADLARLRGELRQAGPDEPHLLRLRATLDRWP